MNSCPVAHVSRNISHMYFTNVDIDGNYTFCVLFYSQIAKSMGPTWGPPGSCRPQMGPMLAPWTLLSGLLSISLTRQKTTTPLYRHVSADFRRGLHQHTSYWNIVRRNISVPAADGFILKSSVLLPFVFNSVSLYMFCTKYYLSPFSV